MHVEDDGIGIPETLPSEGGMGVGTMAYRTRLAGSTFSIRRGSQGGTLVFLSFRSAEQPADHVR